MLDHGQVAFLREQMATLAEAYASLEFPRGTGLIHNDAYTGNLLPDPTTQYGYRLTDWEGTCRGPREIDLVMVGAPGNRFGDRPG